MLLYKKKKICYYKNGDFMVDYCLSFLDMEKVPFEERFWDEEVWLEPLIILWENGKYYVSAEKELLPFLYEIKDFFDIENLAKIHFLVEKHLKGKGFSMDKHVSIIRCFDLSRIGEETEAVRLKGSEEDALFSDLSYLTEKGPVFGIIKNGKVVSLAGAVIRDGVANIHIETAPSERKKGYAKASLLALCNHLRENKIKVLYECRSENTASVNTVTGAGGKEICRYVRFIGRK